MKRLTLALSLGTLFALTTLVNPTAQATASTPAFTEASEGCKLRCTEGMCFFICD